MGGYLYLDTSLEVEVSLYSNSYELLGSRKLNERSSSEKIHPIIDELLNENKICLNDLSGVIGVMGPGSYTGIRMTDGFLQMMRWQKIPIYSFYHFEIPEILNLDPFVFVCRAFKGELFLYKDGKTKLIKEDNFSESHDINLYTHFRDKKMTGDYIYTSDIIQSNAKKIFTYVVDRNKFLEAYYFRPIDKEFKATCEN